MKKAQDQTKNFQAIETNQQEVNFPNKDSNQIVFLNKNKTSVSALRKPIDVNIELYHLANGASTEQLTWVVNEMQQYQLKRACPTKTASMLSSEKTELFVKLFRLRPNPKITSEVLLKYFDQANSPKEFKPMIKIWAGLLMIKCLAKLPIGPKTEMSGIKLYLTCLNIAQKFLLDVNYSHDSMSKILGINKQKLFTMEQFLMFEVLEFEIDIDISAALQLSKCLASQDFRKGM